MAFKFNYRLWIYLAAAVYPFLFHFRCALLPLIQESRINPVCWLVVVMLPLAFVAIKKEMV